MFTVEQSLWALFDSMQNILKQTGTAAVYEAVLLTASALVRDIRLMGSQCGPMVIVLNGSNIHQYSSCSVPL